VKPAIGPYIIAPLIVLPIKSLSFIRLCSRNIIEDANVDNTEELRAKNMPKQP
jgi:hypothetical protein